MLEHLYQKKGCELLAGEDIVRYAKSASQTMSLCWTEDWHYQEPGDNMKQGQQVPVKKMQLREENIHPVYKEWLCDPGLADKVAQSFNEGLGERMTEYPFRHPVRGGMLHEETSLCSLQDTPQIWLDRHWIRHDHEARRGNDTDK